ncbi:phosphotransferase [Algisphaera agarilytica]|uniref:tRNA A-37 threonylcarbamoyl transferase component Bud32 n=1 Tax=Algisphaera agarilytica TaxID=1385975 RepID=A0A7X0H8L4_9BACT|nr:phosphotransferase [Algisphaera agarilytica]MBB6429820.1 tRNA A-37 threonylcarbamoyl transferase component Bud32 [Algisphaera agarilytica]
MSILQKISPLSRHMKPSAVGQNADTEKWVRILLEQKLKAEARGRQVGRSSDAEHDGMVDIRLAGPGEPKQPDEVFERLRWGGLFACVDPNPERVGKIMQAYDNKNGFVLEQGFDELWGGPLGLRIPGVTPRAYCFVARKTHLVPPGQVTDRFTFDVKLAEDDSQSSGFCVRKQVPTIDNLSRRLACKYPDLDLIDIRVRAEKLVNEIFPIFLTREAKALDKLQRTLPEAFRTRVPRPLRIVKNDKGFVTRLDMNWLRNGGQPITQIEFARQSLELLSMLHDHAKLMHLDLRPDNLVITPEGVGFIDFGSSAQIDEDLQASPVLHELFDQMMRTSHIQRVLGQMVENGEVTNEALAAVQGKADPSVDTFYLAVQINHPQTNPELERLIDYQPLGESARALESLTASILKPINPGLSDFKTAADILRGVNRIAQRFAG